MRCSRNYQQARTGLRDGRHLAHGLELQQQTRAAMTVQEMPEVGGGYGRTGRSALFAMGCVAAQRWFPETRT